MTATPPPPAQRVLVRARRVLAFAGTYAVHFLRANYTVAKEIVTPGDGLAPAIVTVPLRSRTRAETAAFMSLISLSPGTMVLAVSDDRTHLVVHGMHATDPDALRAELGELEEQLLRAWRPVVPRPVVPRHEDNPTRRPT
ncbi:Na+/H+ antiporter subunit E [Blastococcus sp. PRF04-17]|uniref:Na+/H+ antiporter subunit E n=1 Tax=Blastococcus sp. PRF04-17 TaxID=2933797 RepID=UPI001FF4FB1E|nr:Na+/H+ antiporter subunit E [Blastococcus sp. PRF04-17]UOY02588.1 Na+/H+ antiporter subunit E [Blastococcus sp. PRF04-17]